MLRKCFHSRTQHWRTVRLLSLCAVLSLASKFCLPGNAYAFRVFDLTEGGLGIGRWDAAPRFFDRVERSLDGGLRYSLQGGSYEAFRDLLQWQGAAPTNAEFQGAVEQAFATWEAVDPTTGLGTSLRFVPDFDTPAVESLDDPSNSLVLNPGAEIDVLARDFEGEHNWRVSVFAGPSADSVTLTSGVENYPAAVASGADILFDTSEFWTLDDFRRRLTGGIGFSIGVTHADDFVGNDSRFYDDNYDGTSSATAVASLTNSFAHLIDPFDPDNSPALSLFDVLGDPGIDSPGVDIFMELETFPTATLQNDDFAARQFLYPFVVPEPSSMLLAGAGLAALIYGRRGRLAIVSGR